MSRRRMALIGAGVTAALWVPSTAHAAAKGPGYEGLRSMGMGNTTVAVTTDRTAVFHNPAGLGLLREKVDISVRPLILAFDGTFFSYIDFLASHQEEFADFDNIQPSTIDDLSRIEGQWAGLEYLPEITIATRNLGFGVYSTFPVRARVETGHFIPKLGFSGQGDFVATWAVGIPLRHETNTFGISIEYFQRLPLEERITTFSETNIYAEEIKKRPFGILGDFAQRQHGASFDAGFMHNIKGFRIAYTLNDLFGVVGGRMLTPRLDIGGAYYFPAIEKIAFMRNIILAVEVADIWGFEERTGRYEHFAKKLHAGAEVDLKYCAFRAGLNQGYPTFGIGIVGGPFMLDYVFFTEETGFYPSQNPRTKHVISLGIGLVAQRTTKDESAPPSPRSETEATNEADR